MKVTFHTTDFIIEDDWGKEVYIPEHQIPSLLQQIAKIMEQNDEERFDHSQSKLEH